jgi:ring-1,2-phenylacetyl-CoA epoxidase subunit PaaC
MLTERPNTDFAHAIVRQLFYSLFAELLWQALAGGKHEKLAQIAAKAEKEARYHVRHSAEWLVRLGDGTEESAKRAQQAVTALAPHIEEMFLNDGTIKTLVADGVIADLAHLRQSWNEAIAAIFDQAKIDLSLLDAHPINGGRQGRHSEEMGFILAQLQYMQKSYPGCKW